MLSFDVWRDLVVAWLRAAAPSVGWRVHAVKRSRTTRTVYVELRCGGIRADVRLSDHRPGVGAGRRSRMFSVRQAATDRLLVLPVFLASRVLACSPHPRP